MVKKLWCWRRWTCSMASTVSKAVAGAKFAMGSAGIPFSQESPIFKHLKWSRRSGLNGRPAVYETAALPTELRRPSCETSQLTRVFSQPQGVFRATTDDRTNMLQTQRSGLPHQLPRHWPLLKPRNRLQPDQGSMAWPREAERLLFVSILLMSYLEHLPLGIGAQFTGKNGTVLIEVCGTAQAFEQLIGK